MQRTHSRVSGRERAGVILLVTALVLSGCSEDTAPDTRVSTPRYTPVHTPEPAIGSMHVVLTTTGPNPDPDGYALTLDDSITRRARINDTVAISNIVLGRHALRLNELATNCVADTTSLLSLFLTSARDTVLHLGIDCVGASIPPGLAGTQLLFVRDDQIYRTTVGSDAAPVLLGAGGEPTWSPDGRRIAFIRNDDVYVMDADGTNVRRIAAGIPDPHLPGGAESAWGFVFAPSGSGLRTAAWSPDGGRLAMYSNDGIVIAPVDRADLVTLDRGSTGAGGISGSATWSPDGKHVAYVTESLDVYVGDVDGSGLSNIRRLTDASTTPFVYVQPAWSPDGSRIAMVACPQHIDWAYLCVSANIVAMNADGSQTRTLAHAAGFAKPSWAPDGQAIAFANTCPNYYRCPSAVLYVSADGMQEGMIVDDAHSPSWRR